MIVFIDRSFLLVIFSNMFVFFNTVFDSIEEWMFN